MARVAHIALKATRIWRYSTVRAILRTNSGTSMPQATLARQRKRRLEQASDLRVRVEIRARSLRAIRQQARGRDLRPGIGRTSMPRKPTNETQSVRPLRRLHAPRLLRPGQGQLGGDDGGPLLLHERDEGRQRLAGLL